MKIFKSLLGFLALILFWGDIFSQEENSEYEGLKMLRVRQYNDLYQYWYQSDRNFSDGLMIEFYHPILENKISNFALIGYKNTNIKDYSLAIEQDIYTPTDTQTDTIDPTDRPYAAMLYFDYARYTNNILRAKNLESHFYLGLIGPGAKGKEMQNGVHALLNNASANGWHNQIGTGLVLDYDLFYRQLLPVAYNFFEFSYFGRGHVGSIFNYLEGGLTFRIGHYNDAFLNDKGVYNYRNKDKKLFSVDDYESLSKGRKHQIPRRLRSQSVEKQIDYLNSRQHRKFQLYLLLEAKMAYQFYDGTTEGSLISFEESVYTEPVEQIDPTIVIGQYGIHLQVNRFIMEFNRFLENDIYSINNYFGYGEIELGWVF